MVIYKNVFDDMQGYISKEWPSTQNIIIVDIVLAEPGS